MVSSDLNALIVEKDNKMPKNYVNVAYYFIRFT